MKICFKCKIKKDLSNFYKHLKMSDGFLNKCKECTKIDSNNHRSENLEYYLKYDKARANLPHRIEGRKNYQKSERGKLSHNKAAKKWRENNSNKYAAHIILNNAIRDGKIIKKNCLFCNSEKSHAHHSDYCKPLQVKWYCSKCHAFKHNVEKIKSII